MEPGSPALQADSQPPGKEPACNAGDKRSIPGSGRSPGEGNGNTPHSCLGHPTDREAWRARVHGVTKESDTTDRLNSPSIEYLLSVRYCCKHSGYSNNNTDKIAAPWGFLAKGGRPCSSVNLSLAFALSL